MADRTSALTSLSAREHIHEGGLASPADPHEAGEDAGAESTTDPPQQLQLALAIHHTHIGQILALHLLQAMQPQRQSRQLCGRLSVA